MQVEIREANELDAEMIFNHLVKLAKHVNLSNKLVYNLESLKNELFRSGADWHSLVADFKNQVIGTCLYSYANINREFHSSIMLHIDVLFVEEQYRKCGVANKLITFLAHIAKNKGINRIELWSSRNNYEARKAYQNIGAIKLDTIEVMRFDVNDLLSDK